MSRIDLGPTPVFVQPDRDVPLVWFDITLAGGAVDDPVGIEGLHRHAGLWARRGAGARTRQVLDEALDELGATVDVVVGRDTMSVSGVCLARNIEDVYAIAGDVLAAPQFGLDEHQRLLRETPQLIDEVRDDDAALATRWFDWQCCPGHPYGRTALGTESSLRRIDSASAKQAWRAAVSQANAVLGFAGDLDAERAHALAAQLLTRLPLGTPRPLAPATTSRPAGKRLIVVDKPERTQTQLRMGHLVPAYQAASAPAIAIAEAALGGMFSSRLMQEIRVARGWSYGVGCGVRRSRLSHWFEVWMATGIEVSRDAALLTQRVLAEYAQIGPSQAEFELARDYLVGELAFTRATARQRMQLDQRDYLLGLPAQFAAELVARIAQTSKAEVDQACAALLAPNDLVTVMVTTADAVDFGTELGTAATFAPTQY